MNWSIVRELATPHPVHAIEWAPEGRSFAYAGGHLYGRGFLGLASAEGDELAPTWTNARRPSAVILSNLAFARAGERELIVAAACSYKWHERGPLVFERVSARGSERLRLIDAPRLADDEHVRDQAIGVAVHGGRILVHHRSKRLSGALAIHACRAGAIEADELALARHDARLAGEHAGTIGWGRDGRWDATLQLPRGLSPRSLALDPSGTRLAIGCKRGNGHDPGAVLLLARSPAFAGA
ncbi:hypothetical protein ACNOYE_39335 [Nannocystaceae bacterium ST9]